MIILDYEQGSTEWLAARAGKVSASNFSKIFTATGSRTTGDTRKSYLYQVAGERLSGIAEDSFKNDWMQRGNDLEPQARFAFEQQTGMFVAQTGMVLLDDRAEISCSPDGLIGDNSGLELKCPKMSTHIAYLEAKRLPSTYKPQVMGQLWVCDRNHWNFASYHPAIKLFLLSVDRDDKYISLLSEAVEEFNAEVNAVVGRLKQ